MILEFEILARGIFRPDQLKIRYEPALRLSLTPAMRAWMDTLWQQKLAQARAAGIPLYDTELFRLVSAHAGQDGLLHLVLGDTSYKEYTTTKVAEFAQGRARQELGNALAVCSVVETTDGYILYEQRQKVAVHAGRYHVIAGFFERERDFDSVGGPDPFAAMRREIREETGIQSTDIRAQYCLGSVYDIANPHGELCFLTELNIPLAEVRLRIPEDDEIKQLLALQVSRESLKAFVLDNHGNISATGEPNLLMYGAVRFGEAWFEQIMGALESL